MILLASEAREISKAANNDKLFQSLSYVENKIEDSARIGRSKVTIFEKLDEQIIETLKDRGFNVEYKNCQGFMFGFEYTEISW